MVLRLASLLLALWASSTLAAEHARPQRVISMNTCLDPVLVELLPREHILALSHYSRDPWRSTIATIARTFPYTNETAEEVVALKPDLVLTSVHSALATRHALKRVGIRFELFEVPQSIDESLAQIRRVSKLLQREAQGEALIARIERAIEAARPAPDTPPLTGAIFQPGGLSAGLDTVVGELMRVAGIENVAARYGVTKYRPLPLEALIHSPPNILLVGDTSYGTPTRAEKMVLHRALRALQLRMTREPLPAKLIYCSGPTMIEALESLVAARENTLRMLVARTTP
jgi:iron complex transport system substrate-binding protein